MSNVYIIYASIYRSDILVNSVIESVKYIAILQVHYISIDISYSIYQYFTTYYVKYETKCQYVYALSLHSCM